MTRRNTFWFLSYSAFFHAAIIGMMDVLMNFYFVSLGNDPQTIAALQSIPRLAGFLTSIPLGLLCNRIGARSMLLWSSLGCAAALCVLLFPSLAMLAVARFVFGICYGAQQIANAPLMIALVPSERRTGFFALHNVVCMLAMAGGSFIGGRVPTLMVVMASGLVPPEWTANAETPFAYGASIALAAALGFIGTAPLLFVKRPQSAIAAIQTDNQALPIASVPLPNDEANAAMPLIIETPSKGQGKISIPWGMLAYISLPLLTFGFTGGLTFPFYNLFFRTQFGTSDQTVGTILSIGWIGMALIPLLNHSIERRLGRAGALGVTMTIAAAGFFGLGLSLPLPISVTFFVIAAAFRNTMQPLYQPLVFGRLPESLHNVVSSVNMIMWNIGWFTATAISGFLQTSIGFGLIMEIVAVGVLLNGIIIVLIFRKERSTPMQLAVQREASR